MPCPAISGAEPCTGSYIALERPSESEAPSAADGNMPSEPVNIAATSDNKSPNRLSVTSTSYCFGFLTSCIAQLSASTCSNSSSGNSFPMTRVTSSFQRRPLSITLRFSADANRLSRFMARSPATRAMRSIS